MKDKDGNEYWYDFLGELREDGKRNVYSKRHNDHSYYLTSEVDAQNYMALDGNYMALDGYMTWVHGKITNTCGQCETRWQDHDYDYLCPACRLMTTTP